MKAFPPIGFLLAACLAAAAAGAEAPAQPEGPAWEKPLPIPTESAFLSDRLLEAQNHFLLDGRHGFVAGREFYAAEGPQDPFLWPVHPFLPLWPERAWLDDSSTVAFNAAPGGRARPFLGGVPPSLTAGDVAWAPMDEVRLHAGVQQNDLFATRSFAARAGMAGGADRGRLSWLGDDLPLESRLGAGGMWDHRGAQIAMQYDQGYWWTASPVSGILYPWQGFNADFLYRAGEDVDISLRDQEWDGAARSAWYDARWRRSELNLGFNGTAPGGWLMRMELGYQHRSLFADSAFARFDERTYPWRLRYRDTWAPVDSGLKVSTRGSVGYRDGMILLDHSEEFRETFGRHEPAQILKAYYREPLGGRPVPTEFLQGPPGDSLQASYQAPHHARGVGGGLEYRYRRSAFLVGVGADGAMEWSAPVFRAQSIDTVDGLIRRAGEYVGSDYVLSNGTVRAFASGGGDEVTWKLQGGMRAYAGHDAGAMEYLPSPWWLGAGGSLKLPGDLSLATGLDWLGPKEVRGWGPLFTVPAHLEQSVAVVQPLLGGRLKLSASLFHAFGREVLEHPNGNPVGFRALAGVQGNF